MKSVDQYKAESQKKWGHTEAYREQAEKTKNYTQGQWLDATDGLNAVFARFAACKNSGESPDSPAAQELVKDLQDHISANFYTCTKQILSGLGQMYIADERFKANIDQNSEGTAEFASQAIAIYCK